MEKYDRNCNDEELEFAVFCIENLAERLNKDSVLIYDSLTDKSDILWQYIIPSYDTLHTQDKEYILDEIMEVMKERKIRL